MISAVGNQSFNFENSISNPQFSDESWNPFKEYAPTDEYLSRKYTENPVKILFDEAHTTIVGGMLASGPISMLGAFLNKIGFETDVNLDKSLTSEYLSSYQILVLFFPQENLSASEVETIINFVDSGGSLLVSGKGGWVYDNFVKIKSSNLNPITEKMNVTYQDDFRVNNPSTITNFLDHPLASNISTVNLGTNTGKFTIDPGANVSILANQSTGDAAFAFREYGNGRVFFSCSNYPFDMLKTEGTEYHFQLMANIFNWLAKNTIKAVETPGWMQAPIRKEYTTTETQRRNYRMLLGDGHSHSAEGSGVGESVTSITDQIDYARALDFDFIAITDHQGSTPQNSWEPGINHIITNNITDFTFLTGVESDVENIGHHGVFGITEIQHSGRSHTPAEWPDVIDTYHSQGGIVMVAHPLGCCGIPFEVRLDYLNNLPNSGIDGFEMANSGYLGVDGDGGPGELAYIMPFTTGSDTHSLYARNESSMLVFAEENTKTSIIEAILDRRVVVIVLRQSSYDKQMVLGDQQWLDEFSYRNSTAHSQYEIISSLIANASTAGWDTSLAESELVNAGKAIQHFNFDKSKRIIAKILNSLYSIDISTDLSQYDPGDQIDVSVSILDSDSASVPVSINAELLNIDKSKIIAENMVTVDSANPTTLSLDIPSNITGGLHRINVLLSFNNTLYVESVEVMVSGDTTPPIVTITSPQSETTIITSSVDVTWTVTETGSGLLTTIIFVDDSQFAEITDITSRTYTITLSEGTHTIKVQCSDHAGNIGEDEIEITVNTTTTGGSTPGFTWALMAMFLLTGAIMRKKKK
ncbi:MAG: hypothetical protein ACXACU_16645 [Candidatus Hodarchaeales archaeon]|jgi:hypothetical protein